MGMRGGKGQLIAKAVGQPAEMFVSHRFPHHILTCVRDR